MVIAFEGMDGSGKSTVSKEVAKTVGFNHETQKIISLMDIDDKTFSKFVKHIRNSQNKHMGFMFYTLRCMLDVDSCKNTIVERSMISTYYFEHNKVSKEEFDRVMNYNVIPNITFILYASKDTRIKRIYNRNIDDSDLTSAEALEEGYDLMLEFANNYNIPYIGIDTEKYTFDEIIDLCTSIINEYQQLKHEEIPYFIQEKNEIYGFDNKYKVKKRMLIK